MKKIDMQQVATTFGSTERIGNAVFLNASWKECSAFLRKAERLGYSHEFLFNCNAENSWVRVPNHLN